MKDIEGIEEEILDLTELENSQFTTDSEGKVRYRKVKRSKELEQTLNEMCPNCWMVKKDCMC